MTDQWQFFPCAMGDNDAFVFVDVGVRDTIDQAPPLLARIRLTYKAPAPNGLPTDAEFDVVSALEDSIQDFADANGCWYVGRVTVAGHRYFHIYTALDESSWADFVAELGEKSGYELRLGFRDDPGHQSYLDELYPSGDDWQVISDLQVIDNLRKHGDDGSQERTVDHWAYFDSEAAARPFVEWATGNGFRFEAEHSRVTEDGQYCVRLTHVGRITLGDISKHTIRLSRMAAESGGDYDGWETLVINGG